MRYNPGDVFFDYDEGTYTRILCWENKEYVALSETGFDDDSEYVLIRISDEELADKEYRGNLGDVFTGERL